MKKICLILLSITVLSFIYSCKTTEKNGNNNNNNGNVTTFKIDENMNENELKKHIKDLFNNIEYKIAKGDYEGWYNSISKKYKDYLNDPKNLKEISEKSDNLFNSNFKINSPKDYFQYVVILSRDGKTLEFKDYKLVNKKHIKVFCLYDKEDTLVYDFIFEDESWKIDR